MTKPRKASNSATAATADAMPDHDRQVTTQDALVDDRPQQQRVDHRDERVEDGRDQEQGEPQLVRLGVADDPADDSWLQLLLGHRGVLPEGPPSCRCSPGRTCPGEPPGGLNSFPCRAGTLSASSELSKRFAGGYPGGVPACREFHGSGPVPSGVACALYLGFAAAGCATTPAQRHSGLGENPVDEAVGPSCRGRDGTDALTAVVPLAEKSRQLAAIDAGYPRAFLEGGLGHMHLLFAEVTQ